MNNPTDGSDRERAQRAANLDPRVPMAAERTLLAWIRTGLAMMGFGFVVARFGLFLRELEGLRGTDTSHHAGLSLWIGTALIVLGVLVNLFSAYQHACVLRQLERGETPPLSSWSKGVVVAALLAALGVGMTAYLLAVG